MKRKFTIIPYLGFLYVLLIMAGCRDPHTRVVQPERNPVILSADAQTLELRVKYITCIDGPKELLEEKKDNVGNRYSQTIKNDWLEIFYRCRQANHENQIINITVKENNSTASRSFKCRLGSFMDVISFTVTQEGKK